MSDLDKLKSLDTTDKEHLETAIARLNALLQALTQTETEHRTLTGLFRTMMENSVGLLTLSTDGRCRVINRDGLNLLGVESKDMVRGLPLADFVHPEDRPDFEKMIEIATAHRKATPMFEARILRPDGATCLAELWSMPVTLGREPAVLTMGRDVTAQKRAEAQRRETRLLLESIFDNVHLMIAYLDLDLNFVRVNRAYAQADGREPSFYPGKNHFALFPNEENEAIFRRVAETGEPYTVTAKPFEYAEHPERGVTHWDWSLVPVRDESGRVQGLILALVDVTERVRADEELQESKERLAADLEAMTRLQRIGALFVGEGGMQGLLEEIVEAAMAITGADMGNIELLDPQSGHLKIMAHRNYEPSWLDFWSESNEAQGASGVALERGERVIVEDVTQSPIFVGTPALDVHLAQGVRAVQATPLVGRAGKIMGVLSTHFRAPRRPDEETLRLLDLLARQTTDIIEHVRGEESLRQRTEELTKRIQELNCLYQMSRLVRETQVPLKDILQELVEVIPSGWKYPDAACARIIIRDEVFTSRNFKESRWRQKAVVRGMSQPVGSIEVGYLEARPEADEGPFLDEERNLLGVIARQVGMAIEEREAVEALRESEEQFRITFEQAAESIVILNPKDGGVAYANPATERMTGYSREELAQLSLLQLIHEESNPNLFKEIRSSLLEQGVWSGRLIGHRKDGALSQVEATASPLRNEQGEVIHYVVVGRDITQEAVLEEQLRQSQKMEAIGTLAGGIAHDFNNLLWAINGYAELIQDELDPASHAYDNLGALLKACGRAKDLVEQILIFGRRGDQEKRILTLAPLIKETLRIIRAAVPTTIRLEQELEAVEQHIWANPTQVQQVVMNLCINAVQAMQPGGGTLAVRLKAAQVDENTVQTQHNLRPGPYLWLSIHDTGQGMDPRTLERVFDPFFTTKQPGEGTGMGLATVSGIVKSHQGAIWAESVPGQGSTFHVYLPEAIGEVFQEGEIEEDLPSGTERILLVDDEVVLVDMVGQMLRRLGYRLTGSSDSREALETVRRRPEAFDLVITDLDMPDLDGLELARQIKALRPNLPIILCTGYPQSVPEELRGMAEAFIAKPISRLNLALLIREVLAASSEGS